MKKQFKTKQMAKGLAALFTASLVLLNTAPASAAEMTEADILAKTEEANGLEEFYLFGDSDNSYTEIEYPENELEGIMPLLDANQIQTETWKISPGTRHVSDKIYLKEGQHVPMTSNAVPFSETYWMGLMKDSNGDVQCVEGTKALSYNFQAPKSGNYRVMAQNRGSQDITVTISYYYY